MRVLWPIGKAEKGLCEEVVPEPSPRGKPGEEGGKDILGRENHFSHENRGRKPWGVFRNREGQMEQNRREGI